MTRDAIVEALAEVELLLPDHLHRGLIANDRVRYYLTLLESAQQHAREPNGPTNARRAEREAAGLHDATLDDVVPRCEIVSAGELSMPAASAIMHGLFAELAVMLQPLRMAGEVAPELGPALAAYTVRLARLHADAPTGAAGRLPADAIDVLIRVNHGSGDSVHQLTIDLHQELTRLRTLIGEDRVDGQVSEESLLVAVWEHTLYVSALADRLRRALRQGGDAVRDDARAADLTGGMNARADEVVRRWIRRCYRSGDGRGLDLIRAADAAADALEHAAFLVTLVPSDVARATCTAFAELPDLVDRNARDYARALEYAARIERRPTSADADAFRVAVDSVAAVGRHCRAAAHTAEARLFKDAPARELPLLSRLVQAFAGAADAIGRCALLLKDEVLDRRIVDAA